MVGIEGEVEREEGVEGRSLNHNIGSSKWGAKPGPYDGRNYWGGGGGLKW